MNFSKDLLGKYPVVNEYAMDVRDVVNHRYRCRMNQREGSGPEFPQGTGVDFGAYGLLDKFMRRKYTGGDCPSNKIVLASGAKGLDQFSPRN